ncbi:MAG TPA: hypothetical protein PKX92_13705 [Edaphocola sp.]|nr:hypothetical protein [Edaphocola sp.]
MGTPHIAKGSVNSNGRKTSAKPFGYASQKQKRSNATHKANASCFTFAFAQAAPTANRSSLKFTAYPVLTEQISKDYIFTLSKKTLNLNH